MFKLRDEQARATLIAAYIGLAGTTLVAIIAGVFAFTTNAQSYTSGVTATAYVKQSEATQDSLKVTANAPTSTPYPTQTQYPSQTPNPTYTPLPTFTDIPLPSITPTPLITLPFQDSFDGTIRPEWKVSGVSLIQDGWLSAANDSLVIEIGDDSLKNFILDFDYKKLRGTHEIIVTFDQQVRLTLGEDGSVWQSFNGSGWSNISHVGSVGGSGHLTIEVVDNTYKILRNQDPRQEITYGTSVGGPIMIAVVEDRYIDNVLISKPEN